MLRKFKISVDGKEYLVEMEEIGGNVSQSASTQSNITREPETQEPMVTKQPASVPTGEGNAIEAPMPGTILGLAVQVGDNVVENQPLLILEAMKMENEIVSPQAGTVIGIHVAKNDVVDAGQVLITIN